MLGDKKLVVIGGGAGIGLAVAKLALSTGMRVVIASRNAPERLEALGGFKGGQPEAVSFDITSSNDHQRLLEKAGRMDHLVIAVRPKLGHAPFMGADEDEARRAFEVKFWGAWRFIRAARSVISDDGSITLTSGIAGERIYPGHTAMAAINGALETLCRALAVELAPLRVNAVSPGFVSPKPPEVEASARRFPLGRLAEPGEAAAAYLSLMASTYQTGSVVVLDGGARLV